MLDSLLKYTSPELDITLWNKFSGLESKKIVSKFLFLEFSYYNNNFLTRWFLTMSTRCARPPKLFMVRILEFFIRKEFSSVANILGGGKEPSRRRIFL